MTTTEEKSIAAALLVLSGFQASLAAGAPWGRAAYGGAHASTLPGRLRGVSAAASLMYAAGAVAIARDAGAEPTRARALGGLTLVMGLGTLVNAASPSTLERALWTPLTGSTALLAWRASRRQTPAASAGS